MSTLPTSACTLEVHEVCPPHRRQALRSLFQVVFGSSVSDEHWQWKYGGPPGSRSLHILACASGGEPVGHVGAVVQPAWCAPAPTAWMAHLTDVMVHPHHRGGLDHSGIYPRIMAAISAHLGRWQAEWGAPVYAYGFPGLTPSRLGHRMGLYRPLYRVQEHTLSGPDHPGWGWRLREQMLSGGFDPRLRAELDALDARLARGQGAGVPPALRKGAAYLQWRYADHPGRPYRMHLLRDPLGRLRGWRVTRDQPRPVVVDARAHPGTRRMRLWAGLNPGAGHTGVTWRAWSAEEGSGPAQDTLIVPVEFQVPGSHQGWPAPAFVPGDTDVF